MSTDREHESDVNEEPTTAAGLAALVAHHRAFLGFLERRVGSRAEAEDLLQEAFARSLDKLEAVRDDEAVVAWFYRVLRNAVVDRARRSESRNNALRGFASELASGQPDEDLERTVCGCVAALTDTLKPAYRDALQRIELEGLPVKDYASALGISSSNAAVRVFRAREALRKQVVRACGTCAEHGCLDCTCAGAPAKRES
jgi:RNA polymerase sigma factor (sigma-70 family)